MRIALNHQQEDFLRVVVGRSPELRDIDDLIRHALAAAEPRAPEPSAERGAIAAPPRRTRIVEHVIAPGTGKALVVRAGQVLRVSQIEGHQCADLNVFHLHQRRERLHTGRTRGMQGPHPGAGDVLWSNAPWERPIMAILASTTSTDTTFAYCSRLIWSACFGLHDRTNCQEIQHEAQREYGLAPWELHESLNLFMYTALDPTGTAVIRHNDSRPGDFVELLALIDVLAVPNVCGDDLTPCSNFGLRPIRVTVEQGLPSDVASAAAAHDRATLLGLPRPGPTIPDEPLHADPTYVPRFPHLPLRPAHREITIDDHLVRRIAAARDTARYGADDAAALRDLVLSWAIERLGTFADLAP